MQPKTPGPGGRATYLAAARCVAGCLAHPEVAARWERPSALERMSVGDLAAHLGRSVTLVATSLEAPDPQADAPVSAETYFSVLSGPPDLDSEVFTGVRRRAHDDAAPGAEAVARRVREVLAGLEERLPGIEGGRQLTVYAGQAIGFDEFLRTRLLEFAVHHDDLRASLPGVDLPGLPDAAVATAVDLLIGVARLEHGDRSVLRALARRERDPDAVLRVL